MDLLWKVSSKAKEIISQKSEASENQTENKSEGISSEISAGFSNEKPVSSLSLETQQGNSDRDASSESEGVVSEHSTNSVLKESDRPLEGSEDAEQSGIKVGLPTGDMKDVSNKAVETAKSFGSFLYGIAKKTGGTLTETAKQLKTTVEENSILGDFSKEQEAFASSKSADSEDASPPPWVGTENEESVKEQILSLSAEKRNFLRSPPTGVVFDLNTMLPMAKTMLKEDPALEKMRFEIVPKLINEENFWRNYFYRVSLVKQSSKISKMSHQKSSSGESTPTSPNKSGSDDSIKAGFDKTTADVVGGDSDATDSPNHEFVSDSFQSSKVSAEDIKQGMKMLGVSENNSKEDDWEKEMQQELQEYEVVTEGNEDDPDWENEIEQMLEGKVKDVV